MDWMNVTISSFSSQSEDKLKELATGDMEEICKAIRLKKTWPFIDCTEAFTTLFLIAKVVVEQIFPSFGLPSLRFYKTKSAGNANLITIQALKHLYSIHERADTCKGSSFIFQEGNLLKSKEVRQPSWWMYLLLVSSRSIQSYYSGPIYWKRSARKGQPGWRITN